MTPTAEQALEALNTLADAAVEILWTEKCLELAKLVRQHIEATAAELANERALGIHTCGPIDAALASISWVTHVFGTIWENGAIASFERESFSRALHDLRRAHYLLRSQLRAPAVERGVAEEREAFEKWLTSKSMAAKWTSPPPAARLMALGGYGDYFYGHVNLGWEAWLARAALSTAGKEQA